MSSPSSSYRTWWSRGAVAGLATALAAVFVTPALAGGSKPTPAPKPTGKPATPTESFGSLAELEGAADEAEAASAKELRKARYQKVVAYLASKPDATDKEKALSTAMDLAEEIEAWAQTVEHANAYLKAYPEGGEKLNALVTKAGALAHVGKKDETMAAYNAAFEAMDVDATNPNTVLGAYLAYADFLLGDGDVDGARAAYQSLKDKFASHQAGGQIAQIATSFENNLDSIGQDATAFPEASKDVEGKPVSVADFKGKVVLIQFWATWCPPCRAEMPNIIKAYKRFKDKGFDVLGVSRDRPPEGEQKLVDYAKAKGMPWRQVSYKGGADEIAEAYGVNGIPHTVLVGRDGKVVRVGVRGEALQRALEKLFGK